MATRDREDKLIDYTRKEDKLTVYTRTADKWTGS